MTQISIAMTMMRSKVMVIAVAIMMMELQRTAYGGAAAYPCDQNNSTLTAFGFCNTRLSTNQRVEDLISRLTLQEKIIQLVNNAAGISRLGIPRYEWWQEALHGVATSPGVRFGGSIPGATSFPMPILTAASFNTKLFLSIGQVVSTEARAMHNLGQAGLTYWSPNVNIYRDPRWGRGQETPGEDPLLSSEFATYYVRGLQDTNLPAYQHRLKVSACCKHMTAYDVDNWEGTDRYHFNAIVTQQDLADTYNVPFQSCVEDGQVSSVMCSYNRLNGVPTCADYNLLTATVRNTWKFDGYIVSDCDSLQVFFDDTNYAKTPEDAVADSLQAGLNLDCGPFLAVYTESAVQKGKVTEGNINQALTYLYTVQMRLGLYDGDPKAQPYGNLGPNDVCSQDHENLALQAAKEGIVLLKNDGRTLPFSRNRIRTLAVIGPHAQATTAMIGNYQGIPCKYTTPAYGLSQYAQVKYSPGCENVKCRSSSGFDAAASTASQADATVLVVGNDLGIEAETLDRTSLELPGHQEELINRVANAANGPVILVIFCAGSVDVSFAKYNRRIQGIIWAGYPGQEGGSAIAQIIFGDHNPGGRLPATWYPKDFSQVSMLDMNMRPDSASGYPGRTYRFYTGPTVYRFGDGLSYSKVSYKFAAAPKMMNIPALSARSCGIGNTTCFHLPTNDAETCNSISFQVNIRVHNRGRMHSSHPVLLFSSPPNAGRDGAPVRQLAGFTRVNLEPGAVDHVTFNLEPCKHLSHADYSGSKLLHLGVHTLSVDYVQHSLPLQISS